MFDRWPHQVRGRSDVHTAIANGHRRILLTSPTGGGKSLLMCDLINDWLGQNHKVAIYTNRKWLIDQLSGVLSKEGIDHGIRAAGFEPEYWPVQICSIATEGSRVFKRQKWDLHAATRIIIDEAHLNSGPIARRIIDAHMEAGAVLLGVTATPIDLGGTYQTLICAGTASELIKGKILVPALMYGPDEPDLKAYKKELAAGKDLSEAKARKAMMSAGIFGRVLDWFNKLNPDRRPSILFAPGVDESVWFAEQFTAAGISAAHIDGTSVWHKGEFHGNSKTLREEIMESSKSGEIKVVCNRFVLREGIDAPWLQHGIFATVFGSLQSYLQSGGRLLRACPEVGKTMATMQDHGGCLDSMTEILTARGWVGPREIRDDDTVAGYDRFCGAIRWCKILHRHERVIDPWEAMFAAKGRCLDLRVTGNHRILTSERDTVGGSKMWRGHYEFMRADALSASTKRVKIPVAGTQDAPGVHLTDDQLRFLGWWITDGTMSGKRQQVSITQADHQPHIAELRECLFANGFHVREVRRTDTGGFIGSRPQTEFQIPKGTCKSRPRKGWWELRHYMEKTLASPLDTMTARQFDIFLHAIHLGDGDKAKGDGAYRISTGNKVFADRLQSLAVRRGWKCNIATGEGGERLNPIYVLNMQKLTAMTLHGANVATADNQLRLVPSPSIVGFTTVWCVANEMDTLVIRRNGMVAIVGNSWHRHGSLNEDRSWSLDCTASSVVGMREERLRRREEREPTRCPQCAKIVTSAVCVCGHVIRQRSRPVVQTDGTFKELVGTIYAPRRISQAANAKSVWKQCYYAAKNSKKGMTFKQAMAWFSQRMNYGWPDTSWPMMPQKTADLFRNVADVPYEDLIHG